MDDNVIEVVDFRKVYGDFVAVDGISFTVARGEIFGLLGPNGAGKTTTLESLEGLRRPDGGSLRIMDVDPVRESRKLRNLIGVQLQTSGLPDSMRVDEAMKFFAAYHGVAPNYDLLARLGLSGKNVQLAEFILMHVRRLGRLAVIVIGIEGCDGETVHRIGFQPLEVHLGSGRGRDDFLSVVVVDFVAHDGGIGGGFPRNQDIHCPGCYARHGDARPPRR